MKLIALLLMSFLPTFAVNAQTPVTGTLLVATDALRDPRFSETVILVLHYGADGALGVEINRPTWIDATEAFPEMQYLEDYTGTVFLGGPIAPANLVTLLRIEDTGDLDMTPVVDDVYVSADPDMLGNITGDNIDDQALRVYAGHVGWDSGQLDEEIAAGNWQVIGATGDAIFSDQPLRLWSQLRTPNPELMVLGTREYEYLATN